MDVNNIKTTIGTFNKLNIVIFIGNNQKLLTSNRKNHTHMFLNLIEQKFTEFDIYKFYTTILLYSLPFLPIIIITIQPIYLLF